MELSLKFTATNNQPDGPLQVSLIRPDQGAFTAAQAFTPPLGDPELAEIRWYLEIYHTWPTPQDRDRAQSLKGRLETWGRALRDSVLPGPEAPRLWQQFLDTPGPEKLLTIDATDPRVLRLPWELLADDSGHLFAQGLSIRRRLQQVIAASTAATMALPIRVLVVVSRPDDVGFLDPRTDARALLTALEELGPRGEVEFLYPPTLTALDRRLRDRTAFPVHVLHFDGHGSYDTGQGLGYLYFENDQHRSDRVDADRLGTLLQRSGIPLAVLSACQSGAQEETNPYASVAARLIRAGLGSVIAMNYSVLVTAADKFVGAFYRELAAGGTVGQAAEAGRRELLRQEQRTTVSRRDEQGRLQEETLELRDWFVPTLYQQAADPVIFPSQVLVPAAGGRSELPLALQDPASPGGLPPEPRHGFHGRARELLRLERALAEHQRVVLHGFGGIGKTTLAAEAGRWFYRTRRFPGGAAFVSFESGGSLQQLCSWVGQAVSGDPDFGLGGGDPVKRLADFLRDWPALLILDNFESVLGPEALMPPAELQAVLDAVCTWTAAGGSRAILTTRDPAFPDSRFQPSRDCRHLELGGLAGPEALDLAAAVLGDYGINRDRVPRDELAELLDLLGGHPLSLYLVLPHLRDASPTDLIRSFDTLLPGFTTGAARERHESLTVSLNFSLSRLSEATRQTLPNLAVFQGGAFEDDLLHITGIDSQVWSAARRDLEQAALLTVEPVDGVKPPFLKFHPTLLPFLAGRLDPARRLALEERYRQRYYDLANYLYKTDTEHPHQARAIALLELSNLRRALDLTLAAGDTDAAADFANSLARFLDLFGRRRELEALRARLPEPVADESGPLSRADYLRLSGQGELLLAQGRAGAAARLFRNLLDRLRAGAAFPAAFEEATTLGRLARCLAALGQNDQALTCLTAAQTTVAGLDATPLVKQLLGTLHAEKGSIYTDLGRFDEARGEYKASLKIDDDLQDHRGQGVTLGQLGYLALAQGDLVQAAQSYRQALKTFQLLGEPEMEAVAWHQLGVVAQRARDWPQAERCYRQSLKLEECLNDIPGIASTCNQLAIVAEGSGNPEAAADWFLRAIELGKQLGDDRGLSKRLSNLAGLYLSLGRLPEARDWALQALAIEKTLDLAAEPWKTCAILAQIAAAQGISDEARQWRRQERAYREAFPATAQQMASMLNKFQPIIDLVVAAAQGDAAPRAELEAKWLPAVEQGGYRLTAPLQRLWAGERDLEALTADLGFDDYTLVKEILRRLD